jgi:aminoglycoside 3-N-acetyltransferase
LGIGIYWATFRHYIEESAAVPFRFLKEFKGIVKENGKEKEETWSYFAAPKGVENCQPNGIPLENILIKKGLISEEKVGKGTIKSVSAKNYLDIGLDELKKNPWLTAKGPKLTNISFCKH